MKQARVEWDSSIPDSCVIPLNEELTRLGFTVQIGRRDSGLQGAVEWALPPLMTLLLSGAAAGSILVGKKFLDGFLEEIGIKSLGTQTAKLLKGVFQAGTQSDNAYYVRKAKRKEPYLEAPKQGTDNAKGEGWIVRGRPSPLRLRLELGGNDAENPPWRVTFNFTRDLEDAFDDALTAIPACLDLVAAQRAYAWRAFQVRLSNPYKYYGRAPAELDERSLLEEVMQIDSETNGVFVFDPQAGIWVYVASDSSMFLPGELLDSFLVSSGLTKGE